MYDILATVVGMARPYRETADCTFTLRLPQSVLTRVDEVRKDLGETRSGVIKRAISIGMSAMDEAKRKAAERQRKSASQRARRARERRSLPV